MQTVLYRHLSNLVSGTNSNRMNSIFTATPANYSIFILLNNSMHAKCLGHSTNSSSNARKKQKRTQSSCPVVSSCSNCSVNSSSSNGSSSKRFLWIRGAANRILSHHVALAPTNATAALIINLYKLPMCARLLPFSDFDCRQHRRLHEHLLHMQEAFHFSCVCVCVGGCEECIK